jgi:hypothetical protein
MERLDQGHLHPLQERPRHAYPGRGLNPQPPSSQAGTLAKSYSTIAASEPLHSLLLLPIAAIAAYILNSIIGNLIAVSVQEGEVLG